MAITWDLVEPALAGGGPTSAEDQPRCRLDAMLAASEGLSASDLHLKAGWPPRVRIHGELRVLPAFPVLSPEDTEAIATAVLRPHAARRFRDEGSADGAYNSPVGRYRVHVYRQRETVALVLRKVLDEPQPLEELGLPPAAVRFAEEQRGLVLVCGPTGSGKTTTLAGIVDHINRTRAVHIVTVEDPIEVLHRDRVASVSQRELGVDVPDFADGMRAALREDPDVIVIGEMRDRATAEAAMSAAETGHLVLSSLHTLDAAETVNRVVELFPDHHQHQARLTLAATLKGTLCQRLVPRADGNGRVPAVEVMVNNGRIERCIVEPGVSEDIPAIIADGEWYGMQTFDQSLISLFESDVIDIRNALLAATNPHDLTVTLRRQGLVAAEESTAR